LIAIATNTNAHIYAREEQILTIRLGWSCWKNKFRTAIFFNVFCTAADCSDPL